MSGTQGVQLDANVVASTTISKSAGVSWPFPVDRRLDQLVTLANRAGANTRRNELAAALVATAPSDGAVLLDALIAWRKRTVREVVLGVDAAAQVVDLPRYSPGRRRRDAV
jgi:hypothetical protein